MRGGRIAHHKKGMLTALWLKACQRRKICNVVSCLWRRMKVRPSKASEKAMQTACSEPNLHAPPVSWAQIEKGCRLCATVAIV